MPEVDGFDVAASLPDAAATPEAAPAQASGNARVRVSPSRSHSAARVAPALTSASAPAPVSEPASASAPVSALASPPAIVFVTAFDQYALRAFDAQAVDYLLKPVDPERLARTVQRLRKPADAVARASVGMPAHLVVAERGKTHVVRCADIEWIEAADNYVSLHLSDRSFLLRRTLAALLEDLSPAFVRTHRSFAVALAAVLRVQPRGKGDATVVLRGGAEVPCSRPYREALIARLRL
ncbi:DNA-binding response regulator [Pararobbsia silviterrae]|uniref:DNA-binding response regulator n=2 Tax=Pararobbsia silviterrae TaxID=1792498 RepID=A0A494YA99_9BURK|nr:DNA-binding response regulator [Pararobbsia silviterrae]